jgi:uncharacterized protein (DUF58 family)
LEASQAANGATIRERTRRVWGWIRAHTPLTATGAAVGIVSALLLGWGGWLHDDRVLLGFGAVLLAVVALAVVATQLAAFLVRRQLRGLTDAVLKLEELAPAWTGAPVAPPVWLLLVEGRLRWVEPATAEAEVAPGGEERVVPSRRGISAQVVRSLDLHDVLGLASAHVDAAQSVTCRITPAAGPLDHVALRPGWWRGADEYHPTGSPAGDPYDMRPYVAGDPLRFVLWKVYARTQRLVVRTPERAVSPVQEVAAWLVAGPGDDAAAGVAWVAVSRGHLGAWWQLGADGQPDRARDANAALDLLQRSAACPAERSGADLAGFLAEVGSARSLVLFTPARRGAWLDAVLSALSSAGRPVEALVCADGLTDAVDGPWWQADGRAEAGPAASAVHRSEAVAVARALMGVGASVVIVDRRTGVVERLDAPIQAVALG